MYTSLLLYYIYISYIISYIYIRYIIYDSNIYAQGVRSQMLTLEATLQRSGLLHLFP